MKHVVKQMVCLVVGLCGLQVNASDRSSVGSHQQAMLNALYASPEQIEHMIHAGEINPTLFTDGEPASVGGYSQEYTALELLLMQRLEALQKTNQQQQEHLALAQTAIQELQKQVEIARQGKSDSLTDAMAAVSLKQ